MIRTEIAVCGQVLLLISNPAEDAVMEVWLSPDECRSFVNGLGEAILRLTQVGVMA